MSDINLKKIYIGGQNMTGKGQLLQFLNSHSNIFIFPFHKFGISYDLENFLTFFNKKNKFNLSNSSTFHCYEKSINFNKYIPIQNLISYLLLTHSSGPDLLSSSITKKCKAYAGDQKTEDINFTFDIDIFFKRLKKYQEKMIDKRVSFEQLENIIFLSFIESVEEYKNFNIDSDFFALFAGNGVKHLDTLNYHFNNYKIIIVNRNFLNRLFANNKRSLLTQNNNFSKDVLYYTMLFNLKKNIENNIFFENTLKKIKVDNKSIIEIEFEKLINQTDDTIKLILSFLKLQFEDSTLNPSWINSTLSLHNDGLQENDNIESYFSRDKIDRLIFFSKNKMLLKIYTLITKIIFRLKEK